MADKKNTRGKSARAGTRAGQKAKSAARAKSKLKQVVKKVDAAAVSDVKAQIMKQLDKKPKGKISGRVVLEQNGLQTRNAPIAPQIKQDDIIAKEVMTMKTPHNKTGATQREGVVPPPMQPKAIWQDRALTTVLLLGVVLIVTLLALGKSPVSPISSPALALKHIGEALESQNGDVLAQYIDINQLATNAVRQLQPAATFNAEDLPASLQDKFPTTNGDINVEEGLIALFKQDAHAFLAGTAQADLPAGLFKQTLTGITGGHLLCYKEVDKVVADDDVADVRVLVARKGLLAPLPVDLRFNNTADGWKLVDIPNLNPTLARVAGLETSAEVFNFAHFSGVEPAAGSDNLNKAFSVKQAFKRKASSTLSGENMLVTVEMTNTANQAIKAFEAAVVFTDADGRYMHSYTVADTVGVSAGKDLQKSWKIPVNIKNRVEKHVYTLPLGAIGMKIIPTQITYAGGQTVVL